MDLRQSIEMRRDAYKNLSDYYHAMEERDQANTLAHLTSIEQSILDEMDTPTNDHINPAMHDALDSICPPKKEGE